MAWASSTSWVTGDTPALATVLNNIGLDIRTWGGNVDAGGYALTNAKSAYFTVTDTRTSLLYDTGQVVLTLKNASNTAGNYISVMPLTQGGVACGAVAFKVSDHTNGYASLVLATRGAGGFGERLTISPAGVVTHHATPTYADNAAALTGGLTAGQMYRTSTGVLMEVY